MSWRHHAAVISGIVLIFSYFVFSSPNVTLRSSDGRWADSEYQGKGRDFKVLVWNFENYKLQCAARNAVLIRATPELWYNVFAWPSYFTDLKWRVPYSPKHAEIGGYYPAANSRGCANNGVTEENNKQIELETTRYLATLR